MPFAQMKVVQALLPSFSAHGVAALPSLAPHFVGDFARVLAMAHRLGPTPRHGPQAGSAPTHAHAMAHRRVPPHTPQTHSTHACTHYPLVPSPCGAQASTPTAPTEGDRASTPTAPTAGGRLQPTTAGGRASTPPLPPHGRWQARPRAPAGVGSFANSTAAMVAPAMKGPALVEGARLGDRLGPRSSGLGWLGPGAGFPLALHVRTLDMGIEHEGKFASSIQGADRSPPSPPIQTI